MSGGPLKVLLIEDNPGDARLIREMLAEAGDTAFRLECADQLSAAKEILGSREFDLILLDLSLPDSHGLDTFTIAQACAPETPIVVLSGLDDQTLAVKSVQSGAQDYLVKGQVDSNLLARSIRYAVERKRAEIERARLLIAEQKARKEAEEANRLKDEFLATVSHELRTPLNAILGWSRMLCSSNLDELTYKRAVETIERNAKSQAQLINDLLEVSSIITGKLRLDVKPVEMITIIDAALDTVRPAAEAKDIRLQVTLATDTGPILGDANRLQQIVWNLLSNAIKFTPGGGEVEIRLDQVKGLYGPQVEITVNDTGQGISPDFLPYVFDRFRQADSTSTRRHGGLGLGLAIVRHLVELHGGTVKADSPGEGKGATFVVSLPMTADRRQAIDSEPAFAAIERARPELVPVLGGLRILVVDDELDAREILTTMLAGCKAEVKTAASAAEALELFKQWSPDILVCDIEMPGEDGYSLIEKVRALDSQRDNHTPAVAVTAYTRVEDRVRALAAGYQMHVPKPVEMAELVAVIVSLTRRNKKRLNVDSSV